MLSETFRSGTQTVHVPRHDSLVDKVSMSRFLIRVIKRNFINLSGIGCFQFHLSLYFENIGLTYIDLIPLISFFSIEPLQKLQTSNEFNIFSGITGMPIIDGTCRPMSIEGNPFIK